MRERRDSVLVKGKLPCPRPPEECGSSDAYHIYNDHAYCFSCKYFWPENEIPTGDDMETAASTREDKVTSKVSDMKEYKEIKQILEYPCKGDKARGIPTVVAEFYDVKASFDLDGEIDAYYYPYYANGNVAKYKVRKLPKTFYTIPKGTIHGLFGQTKFARGGKRIVVTEGELDCLTVAYASYHYYKKWYPVVSLPNGVGSDKAIIEARDYLRSFDEVVLFYDQDEAEQGQNAAKAHARIIGVDKTKIAKFDIAKDANDILNLEYEECSKKEAIQVNLEKIMKIIWEAEYWSPEGILTSEELWQEVIDFNEKESIPYPVCVNQLNSKLKGRRIGEITLWASGTGSGKSTIVREIILHTRETTDDQIGIIALEENPGETARHLCAVAMNKNPSEETITPAEMKPYFDHLFHNDRIRVLNHYDSESKLLDTMEQMVLMGCKWIVLDHLTLLASETLEHGSENANIDKIMNKMRKLVKQNEVHIDVISQLRKMGDSGKSFESGILPSLDDLKGSGAIKQVAMNVIGFARNLNAENDLERNTIKMAILKCRFSGLSGPVPDVYYSRKTNRIVQEPPTTEYKEEQFEIDDIDDL